MIILSVAPVNIEILPTKFSPLDTPPLLSQPYISRWLFKGSNGSIDEMILQLYHDKLVKLVSSVTHDDDSDSLHIHAVNKC